MLSFSIRPLCRFGSYYQMVAMFTEVENIPSSKEKQTIIQKYANSLNLQNQRQFYALINWYSNKEPIRISSKVINKYYLAKRVSAIDHQKVEPKLVEGGVMKMLCQQDRESQLSIFDANAFLRYLCSLEGNGAQAEKSRRILMFGQRVSVLEGIFLLKLIQRKLTIGASIKTFRKLIK